MDQEYLKEDLYILLGDIGEMIEEELTVNKTANFHIRVKSEEKKKIEENARKYGFTNSSQFLRKVALDPQSLVH